MLPCHGRLSIPRYPCLAEGLRLQYSPAHHTSDPRCCICTDVHWSSSPSNNVSICQLKMGNKSQVSLKPIIQIKQPLSSSENLGLQSIYIPDFRDWKMDLLHRTTLTAHSDTFYHNGSQGNPVKLSNLQEQMEQAIKQSIS